MVLGSDTPSDGMVGITSTGDDGSGMGMKTVALAVLGLWVVMKVFD